jgi:hypothetical protein
MNTLFTHTYYVMSENICCLLGCSDQHNEKDFQSKYTRRISLLGWMTVVKKLKILRVGSETGEEKMQRGKDKASKTRSQMSTRPVTAQLAFGPWPPTFQIRNGAFSVGQVLPPHQNCFHLP